MTAKDLPSNLELVPSSHVPPFCYCDPEPKNDEDVAQCT